MELNREEIADAVEASEVEEGLVAESPDEPDTVVSPRRLEPPRPRHSALHRTYLLLPLVFLTVALLGGLRLASETKDFVFWRPALVCLIFAAFLMVLFTRARLIELGGWFSDEFTPLKNAANGAVLAALFAASVQVFNATLPEQGMPFWVVSFCFFWTLWNNLFADFDGVRLLRSLGALFGLAFISKYILLANLAAPTAANWWQGILENPGKEAVTWLLDLPRFSASTGYIQFFTLTLYLLGLHLLRPQTRE